VLWLRWGNTQSALQEYQLVATFLATLSLQDIRVALNWIQVPLSLFQPFPFTKVGGKYCKKKGLKAKISENILNHTKILMDLEKGYQETASQFLLQGYRV